MARHFSSAVALFALPAALAALHRGRIGESYILGGENVMLSQLLADVSAIVGRAPPRRPEPERTAATMPSATRCVKTGSRS